MDALRERRRDRAPENPAPRTHRVRKQQQAKWTGLLTSAVLLNIFQFILIVILIFSNSSKPSLNNIPIQLSNHAPNSSVIHTADPSAYDCYVTIYAYDRPKDLLRLLQDIHREATSANITVGVNVIDDNSLACVFPPVHENIFDIHGTGSLRLHLHKLNLHQTTHISCAARSRFEYVEQYLRARGWNLYVSQYRHARRRYWHLIRMAHALLHPVTSKYYLFLPDDDRLSSNFFPAVFSAWNSIQDSRKLTLMLHVEESRERQPVWTDLKPRNIGADISRIGWVESGNFICTHELLSFLNWSFPRVPAERWIRNPPISSGVGAALSDLIHTSGKRMFRTRKSYVAHVGVSLSKMNAEFRQKNTPALLTKYFADGDETYQKLLADAATVTASLASQWTRETALHSAVSTLAPQVDHINVYLNDYDAVPSYLLVPYITVMRSQDNSKGDIGDIGKFFWFNEINTEFHLTADDDNVYPPDYFSRMLTFWQKHHGPVAVGAHGIRMIADSLIPPDGRRGKGYYGSREVWLATEKVEHPMNVHIIGTGTLLYRPTDIGDIELDSVFPHPNMADIWFGILAQKLKLPMMTIPHEEGWITSVPGTFGGSIYKRSTRSRSADRLQTEAAKGAAPWQLYQPKLVA